MKNFKKADSLLESALGKACGRAVLDLARIDTEWAEIVGEQMAEVSRPVKLQGGELTIWVREPVWLDSMIYHKRKIAGNINRIFPENIIKKINITQKTDLGRENKEVAEQEPEQPLDETLPEEIEKSLSSIQNSDLRFVFKRVILKDRNKKRNS